ncbi:MAG: hypothetical protein OWU84_08575 [Firmicutes bacterium]|nr:hypothetical protein [Bacillota bacterium]
MAEEKKSQTLRRWTRERFQEEVARELGIDLREVEGLLSQRRSPQEQGQPTGTHQE